MCVARAGVGGGTGAPCIALASVEWDGPPPSEAVNAAAVAGDRICAICCAIVSSPACCREGGAVDEGGAGQMEGGTTGTTEGGTDGGGADGVNDGNAGGVLCGS